MNIDAITAIRTNASVREFTAEPVDESTVIELLDDARFASSGGNRQPWRVASVTDPALRAQLAALMQPVWDEYVAASVEGQVPFNSVNYQSPEKISHAPNPLLDRITEVPVVLAVAADLRSIVAFDKDLDRTAIVPGGSIYPFCWNVLLAARARGLGGVLTTFLSRPEDEAGTLLGLPPDHALAAVLFIGHPVKQLTKLRRNPVDTFATVDRFDGSALG